MRVKAPTGAEAYQPPGSASGSRGYDANGSLHDSGHGWLADALARTSLPRSARFLADGKSRTALLPAQRLQGGTVASFRCSGGTGCATAPASPLLDWDIRCAWGWSLHRHGDQVRTDKGHRTLPPQPTTVANRITGSSCVGRRRRRLTARREGPRESRSLMESLSRTSGIDISSPRRTAGGLLPVWGRRRRKSGGCLRW